MKRSRYNRVAIFFCVVAAVVALSKIASQSIQRQGLIQCGVNLSEVFSELANSEIDDRRNISAKGRELLANKPCPVSGRAYRTTSAADWSSFEIYCPGSHHLPLSQLPDYPRYGTSFPEGPQLSNSPHSAMNSRDFEI